MGTLSCIVRGKFIRRSVSAMDKETDKNMEGTLRRAYPTVPQIAWWCWGRVLKRNQIPERGAPFPSKRCLRQEDGFIAGRKPKARFSRREGRA